MALRWILHNARHARGRELGGEVKYSLWAQIKCAWILVLWEENVNRRGRDVARDETESTSTKHLTKGDDVLE